MVALEKHGCAFFETNKGGSDVRVNEGINYKAVSIRKKLHSQHLDFTNV